MKRPQADGSVITTPRAGQLMQLFGDRVRHRAASLSGDEFEALKRLYGYVPEKPHKRPPEPTNPGPSASYAELQKYKDAKRAWDVWEDPRPLMQAGADRNLLRHAEMDGIRLIAWIARFVEPGSDPLKTLITLASDAGWDVDPEDFEFASADE
jgi:hypothetical protein